MAQAGHRAARVAWVTGASRGVGRGIAVALGGAGWVVYVTARSSAAGRTTRLPGTVEAAAEAVSAAGGRGVAVACDHRDDEAVAKAAERITAEQGHLDLLLALLIGIATIRVSRQDLAGAGPAPQEAAPQPAAPQPAAPQPGTEQRHEDRAALAAAARPCRLR